MDIGFFEEEVSDSGAELLHLSFGEVFTLSDLARQEWYRKGAGRLWTRGRGEGCEEEEGGGELEGEREGKGRAQEMGVVMGSGGGQPLTCAIQ